jgi:MHS family proline/betaine transporter-like MFS transporter
MIAAASIGNALDFYDFIIYALFATSISKAFFTTNNDPINGLILTFATFGVSFGARPIGATILGRYADRRGRVACMLLCISLMSLGAAAIALMPTRAEIGVLAPLGVLAARLLQGFALGGEYGSSSAFMIEQSGGRPTWASTWQSTSQLLSSTVASGLAWLLSVVIPKAYFDDYGFRIAMAIGALAGLAGFILRSQLEEPSLESEIKKEAALVTEGGLVYGVIIAAGLISMGTATTYLALYLPTFATDQLHLSSQTSLGSSFFGRLVQWLILPITFLVANQFDTKRRFDLMIASCVLTGMCAYPTFLLLQYWPSGYVLFLVPFAFGIIGIYQYTPLSLMIALVFPVAVRSTGMSVGYALGVALFGGTAPLINTWLIKVTGDPKSPALYLIFVSLMTIGATLLAQRRIKQLGH